MKRILFLLCVISLSTGCLFKKNESTETPPAPAAEAPAATEEAAPPAEAAPAGGEQAPTEGQSAE